MDAKATSALLVEAFGDIGLETLAGRHPAWVTIARNFLVEIGPPPVRPDRAVLQIDGLPGLAASAAPFTTSSRRSRRRSTRCPRPRAPARTRPASLPSCGRRRRAGPVTAAAPRVHRESLGVAPLAHSRADLPAPAAAAEARRQRQLQARRQGLGQRVGGIVPAAPPAAGMRRHGHDRIDPAQRRRQRGRELRRHQSRDRQRTAELQRLHEVAGDAVVGQRRPRDRERRARRGAAAFAMARQAAARAARPAQPWQRAGAGRAEQRAGGGQRAAAGGAGSGAPGGPGALGVRARCERRAVGCACGWRCATNLHRVRNV